MHLGCGHSKLPGAVGVDVLDLPTVDVVHNLDHVPWSFADSTVDILFVHSVLEHLGSLINFLNEVQRVGKNGARIIIAVPYFRSVDSFTDPTHKHFFTSQSLDYFLYVDNQLAHYQYTQHKFEKIGFWYGWPQPSANILVRWFKLFIGQKPRFYDQYLALLLPAKVLIWELEVRK